MINKLFKAVHKNVEWQGKLLSGYLEHCVNIVKLEPNKFIVMC